MSNVRMKIAAGATVLGLGGLGGYALATNDTVEPPTEAATLAAKQKPKVRTQVVRRTVHVRPDPEGASPAGISEPAAAAAPPVVATPVLAPDAAPAAREPVSTYTSGSAGSSSYEDDEGENESDYEEIESEAGDD